MKKLKSKKKLSLEKLNITRLNRMNNVIGGSLFTTDGTEGEELETKPTQFK